MTYLEKTTSHIEQNMLIWVDYKMIHKAFFAILIFFNLIAVRNFKFCSKSWKIAILDKIKIWSGYKNEKNENFKNPSIAFLYYLEIYLYEQIWLNLTCTFLQAGRFILKMAISPQRAISLYFIIQPSHKCFQKKDYW